MLQSYDQNRALIIMHDLLELPNRSGDMNAMSRDEKIKLADYMVAMVYSDRM
jgi:hypothetical protein